MSNPLTGLRDLINSKAPASIGTVVQDKGTVVLVSTATGVKEAPKVSSSSFTKGDSVRMFDGVVVGKVKDDSELPQYFV